MLLTWTIMAWSQDLSVPAAPEAQLPSNQTVITKHAASLNPKNRLHASCNRAVRPYFVHPAYLPKYMCS